MIPTRRVFIAGVSGSGKSTTAWRHYLAHYKRRLILDYTGEWGPHANARTFTVRETIEAIRQLHSRGDASWTVAAGIDPDEDLPELIDWLIPVPEVNRSPVITMGGLVLLNDECDIAVPIGTFRLHNRTLYRRSRHVGLSVISLTQRPENVNKEVADQAGELLALRLHAPRALAYIEEATGYQLERATLQEWTRQHPHGGLYLNRDTAKRAALTEDGRWVSYPEPVELAAAAGRAAEQAGHPAGRPPVSEGGESDPSASASASSAADSEEVAGAE